MSSFQGDPSRRASEVREAFRSPGATAIAVLFTMLCSTCPGALVLGGDLVAGSVGAGFGRPPDQGYGYESAFWPRASLVGLGVGFTTGSVEARLVVGVADYGFLWPATGSFGTNLSVLPVEARVEYSLSGDQASDGPRVAAKARFSVQLADPTLARTVGVGFHWVFGYVTPGAEINYNGGYLNPYHEGWSLDLGVRVGKWFRLGESRM